MLRNDALTTVARQKVFMDITTNTFDTVIERLINQASGVVKAYIGRDLKRKTVSNRYVTGSGSGSLNLDDFPIDPGQTFTLTDDGDAISSDDYEVDNDAGIVYLVDTSFSRDRKRFKVSYTAGYYLPQDAQFGDATNPELDLPEQIEGATQILVSKMFRQVRKQGSGIERIRVDGQEIQFFNEGMLDKQLQSMLDPYKTDHVL